MEMLHRTISNSQKPKLLDRVRVAIRYKYPVTGILRRHHQGTWGLQREVRCIILQYAHMLLCYVFVETTSSYFN